MISKDCMELWLVLRKCNLTRPITSNDRVVSFDTQGQRREESRFAVWHVCPR